ncbi:MAG: hypothetical protein K6A68_11985, partial [Clostridiales bacterium]|nr:hypothetical protein [Clostridiales bacterium]
MIIATNAITAKVQELAELKKMNEELNMEIEKLTDEIKTFMSDEDLMYAGETPMAVRSTRWTSNTTSA